MLSSYAIAMRNYATFSGRSSRSQYWLFILLLLGMSVVALMLDAAVSTPFSQSSLFIGITYLVHLLPNLGVTVRRLHDTGHSGWWILVFPVALFFLCQPGTLGDNKYGHPPQALSGANSPQGGALDGSIPQRPAPQTSVADELERLAQLRASGSLTDAEFNQMKSRLIG